MEHRPGNPRLWHGQWGWRLAQQAVQEAGMLFNQVWDNDGSAGEGQWSDGRLHLSVLGDTESWHGDRCCNQLMWQYWDTMVCLHHNIKVIKSNLILALLSAQVMQLQEAKALLKEDDDLIIAVYDYWLNKRLRLVEIWLLYWALYILNFKGIQ